MEDWRGLVPEHIAQKFVDAPVGAFKHPNMCSRLVARFPDASAPRMPTGGAPAPLQGCAVVLLGDAAHVFPPGALRKCAPVVSCVLTCLLIAAQKLLANVVPLVKRARLLASHLLSCECASVCGAWCEYVARRQL